MNSPQKPEEKNNNIKINAGRSPAYPYLSLNEAVDLSTKLHSHGATKATITPETVYQIWKMGSQSSASRQSLAALNHFGLVDYIGRGDDRKVKLSELALRIVLDRQEISPERDFAVREAALKPSIHTDLYEKYGHFLPSDVVIETYLCRDRSYNAQAAKSLIKEYRATLAYAGLDKPEEVPAKPIFPLPPLPPPDLLSSTDNIHDAQVAENVISNENDAFHFTKNSNESHIKILFDGEKLRISAHVDLKGARRLLKALKANMALLENDEDEDPENI